MKLILFEDLFNIVSFICNLKTVFWSSYFLVLLSDFIEYKLSKEPSFAEKKGSLLSIPS